MKRLVVKLAESAEGALEIQLLGGFSVRSGGRSLQLPATASRLVALLAIRDRPLDRAFVASVLCPDVMEATAKARLRTTVWRLGQRAPGLITAAASEIGLTAAATADIRDVRALLIPLLYGEYAISNGLRPTATGALELSRKLALELLPDWDDPWVVTERLRQRQLGLHGLEHLAAVFLQAGAVEEALALARTATELDPLRESAQYMFIRALQASGDRLGAVVAYARFCDALAREWALDPSPGLSTLALGTDNDLLTRNYDRPK
jgi:DNA-binding SARP family transcriptional activator